MNRAASALFCGAANFPAVLAGRTEAEGNELGRINEMIAAQVSIRVSDLLSLPLELHITRFPLAKIKVTLTDHDHQSRQLIAVPSRTCELGCRQNSLGLAQSQGNSRCHRQVLRGFHAASAGPFLLHTKTFRIISE